MVTAFCGPTVTFWSVKCAGQPVEPEIIATNMNERYRHYPYEYGLNAQMQSLHMQPKHYTTYADFKPRLGASNSA